MMARYFKTTVVLTFIAILAMSHITLGQGEMPTEAGAETPIEVPAASNNSTEPMPEQPTNPIIPTPETADPPTISTDAPGLDNPVIPKRNTTKPEKIPKPATETPVPAPTPAETADPPGSTVEKTISTDAPGLDNPVIPVKPENKTGDIPTFVSPDAPPLAERIKTCTDVAPGMRHTCEQQKGYGKCSAEYMTKYYYCSKTCNLPPCKAPCTDIEPPGGFSCSQQKDWGKCNAGWMKAGGYCKSTCQRC